MRMRNELIWWLFKCEEKLASRMPEDKRLIDSITPKFNEKELGLLEKFEEFLDVCHRCEIRLAASYLGLTEQELLPLLVKWHHDLSFKIDGGLIVVTDETAFIAELDQMFLTWRANEDAGDAKKESAQGLPPRDPGLLQRELWTILETTPTVYTVRRRGPIDILAIDTKSVTVRSRLKRGGKDRQLLASRIRRAFRELLLHGSLKNEDAPIERIIGKDGQAYLAILVESSVVGYDSATNSVTFKR